MGIIKPVEKDKGPPTWITKLVLPILSLLATITSLLRDQPVLAWCLFTLTVVLFASGFYGPVVAGARGLCGRKHDNRLARQAWPDLSALVERFVAFVNPSNADTLHAAATSVHDQAGQDVARVIQAHGIVPISVFYGFWDHVRQHCQQDKRDLGSLQRTIAAFNWLIGTYNYHVVQTVLYRARQELRPLLGPDARSALELSRERFLGFLDDYTAFLENLNGKLESGLVEIPSFERVGPL